MTVEAWGRLEFGTSNRQKETVQVLDFPNLFACRLSTYMSADDWGDLTGIL